MHFASSGENSFFSNGKGQIDDPNSPKWYHGSPLSLEILAAGSSITRNRKLAAAFSHKPTLLSVSDDGTITHNGQKSGYLYEVDETVSADDIRVHVACEERDPWEWVTQRPLRLKLLQQT